MIANIDTFESVSDVLERMFSRLELPVQVAVMESRPSLGIKVGDVLTWNEQDRAYATQDGKYRIMADYVRYRWLREFCWAPPPKPVQALLMEATA